MSNLVVDISAPAPGTADGEVTLVANGQQIGGWEHISITNRLEGYPNSFEIGLSALDPSTGSDLVVRPGDACQVKIGSAVVITGYVDRVNNGGSANTHQLQVVGRGKCQDLVDCSAEWDSGQISEATALEIATKLASPYGIDVKLGSNASAGPKVPQFNLNYGETAADIIERVSRNAALLAYEDVNGQLVLDTVGSTTAASGAVYGGNVEAWSVELSMDQRYSEIICTQAAQNTLGDLTGGDAAFFFDHEPDPNVPRHRLRYMVLEQIASDITAQQFTTLKAKWEVARRAGRSTMVSVTLDSWADSSKQLWQPNTLVPVALPGLPDSISQLCLSEVTFRRDESGTHADLVLLPPEAFKPEPISLSPVNISDVQKVSAS